jgi:hypothetical protein
MAAVPGTGASFSNSSMRKKQHQQTSGPQSCLWLTSWLAASLATLLTRELELTPIAPAFRPTSLAMA